MTRSVTDVTPGPMIGVTRANVRNRGWCHIRHSDSPGCARETMWDTEKRADTCRGGVKRLEATSGRYGTGNRCR